MKERISCNEFMLSTSGRSTGERGIINSPCRVLGFAGFTRSDNPLARSYFPTAVRQLLPKTAMGNSRARACGWPSASRIAWNSVGVTEKLSVKYSPRLTVTDTF